MLTTNKIGGIKNSDELIQKYEKLSKSLKLFKSRNLKSKKLSKSQKLAKSEKKQSESRNLPKFNTTEIKSSFLIIDTKTIFNYL